MARFLWTQTNLYTKGGLGTIPPFYICSLALKSASLPPPPHSFLPTGCNSSPYADEGYHGRLVPLPKYPPCLLNDPENWRYSWLLQRHAPQSSESGSFSCNSICDLRICQSKTIWSSHGLEIVISNSTPTLYNLNHQLYFYHLIYSFFFWTKVICKKIHYIIIISRPRTRRDESKSTYCKAWDTDGYKSRWWWR